MVHRYVRRINCALDDGEGEPLYAKDRSSDDFACDDEGDVHHHGFVGADDSPLRVRCRLAQVRESVDHIDTGGYVGGRLLPPMLRIGSIAGDRVSHFESVGGSETLLGTILLA